MRLRSTTREASPSSRKEERPLGARVSGSATNAATPMIAASTTISASGACQPIDSVIRPPSQGEIAVPVIITKVRRASARASRQSG